MRKVILDFCGLNSREEIHDHIAKQMDFPPYYGRNLDALYDCLTDIVEPTAIGCCFPERLICWTEADREEARENQIEEYLEKLKCTLLDAEEDNHHLAVFFGSQMK